MLRIAIVDAGCCRSPDGSPTEEYAKFLQAKFEGRIEVSLYDVEAGDGPMAVPPDLYQSLASQGANSVPVLAIDGELIAHGQLPDWMDSLDLVHERLEAHQGADAPGA